MAKKSREKGKRGELELSHKFAEYGYNCRRGQQYCGADGSADVVGLPGIHIECKRVEKLNIHDAIEQAKRDAREDELPFVFHRRNREQWRVTGELKHLIILAGMDDIIPPASTALVTLLLCDWIELYREYKAGGECGLHKT